MKLRNLLLFSFIPFMVVSLLSGMLYLNGYAGERYRAQVEEELLALSKIAEHRIAAVMDNVRDSTLLIASRTQMRISLREWNATGDPQHSARIRRILIDAIRPLEFLETVTIFDASGRVAAQVGAEGTNRSMYRPNGKRFELVHDQGKAHLHHSEPLEIDGERIGYLLARYDAGFLNELISDRTGLGSTGEWLFAIRDADGDALVAVPLKYDPEAAFTRKVSADRLDKPIIQALLGNEMIMGQATDYREVPVLAATRYLPQYDWGMVVKIDEAEVHELMDEMRQFIVWFVLIVTAAAILIGLLFSRLIAMPLEKLQRHASSITRGDHSHYALEGGCLEVRSLGLDINQMVAALSDMNQNLQHKVAERTQELAAAKKQLEALVVTDPLTGVNNRRYFDERLKIEFDRASRYQSGLVVALLDLDHFKVVNDQWGHDAGDEVLKGVGAYIQGLLRSSDAFARLGGEEFGLILPVSGSVRSFMERLRLGIAGLAFGAPAQPFHVSCSVGWCHWQPDIHNAELMVKRADEALYEAKAAGRNCVVEYRKPPILRSLPSIA